MRSGLRSTEVALRAVSPAPAPESRSLAKNHLEKLPLLLTLPTETLLTMPKMLYVS